MMLQLSLSVSFDGALGDNGGTVASGQINPDWDCLQANHMWTSSKTDSLI
jgi:hypothetical protein